MPLTGDFAKLKQFQQRLGRMTGVPEKIAPACATHFHAFTDAGFATSTDPYGGSWKTLLPKTIGRHGPHRILSLSGKMQRSATFRPYGPKVKIDIGEFYARFHISTGRGFLPLNGRLPDPWGRAIDRESTKAFTAIAEGR